MKTAEAFENWSDRPALLLHIATRVRMRFRAELPLSSTVLTQLCNGRSKLDPLTSALPAYAPAQNNHLGTSPLSTSLIATEYSEALPNSPHCSIPPRYAALGDSALVRHAYSCSSDT